MDFLTPNQTEAKLLTGIDADSNIGAEAAGKALLRMGAQNVIITMGSQGAMFLSNKIVELIPAYHIDDAVDPSGAGDAFMGGFSVALTEGKEVLEAVKVWEFDRRIVHAKTWRNACNAFNRRCPRISEKIKLKTL